MSAPAPAPSMAAPAPPRPERLSPRLRRVWLGLAALLYVGLTAFQLNLPGLHYDEAKEAGVNAVELLTGAPVTAFRDAALALGNLRLPLMVQDYIGALNVYLAMPLLALTGIGVPNLRALPVLTGLLALLALERAVSTWIALATEPPAPPSGAQRPAAISLAALLAVTLLAVSPSFVFWSRQGIFVTNLTQPLVLAAIWQGLEWLRRGRSAALRWSALAAGAALYAKLLAFWVIVPFALMAGAWWLWQRRRGLGPTLGWALFVQAAALFLLPLTPLLLFNLQTGGTLASVGGNLSQSYYGVDNLAVGANLVTRLGQLVTVLRGDQFWYLGAVYADAAAPWLAGLIVLIGLWRRPRVLAPPLLLLALGVAASLFTVSDLFVTHYALLQPLLLGVVGLGLATLMTPPPTVTGPTMTSARLLRVAGSGVFVLWLALDLTATVRYHGALARSGGLADHADTSYHLAYYLRYNGLGAPVALDWGFDAPVRFLSAGTVRPIEVFGYASPTAPDADFVARVRPFFANADNVYLLHAPAFNIFAGRRDAFFAAAAADELEPVLEQTFTQRDGTPLVELWRLVPH